MGTHSMKMGFSMRCRIIATMGAALLFSITAAYAAQPTWGRE